MSQRLGVVHERARFPMRRERPLSGRNTGRDLAVSIQFTRADSSPATKRSGGSRPLPSLCCDRHYAFRRWPGPLQQRRHHVRQVCRRRSGWTCIRRRRTGHHRGQDGETGGQEQLVLVASRLTFQSIDHNGSAGSLGAGERQFDRGREAPATTSGEPGGFQAGGQPLHPPMSCHVQERQPTDHALQYARVGRLDVPARGGGRSEEGRRWR